MISGVDPRFGKALLSTLVENTTFAPDTTYCKSMQQYVSIAADRCRASLKASSISNVERGMSS